MADHWASLLERVTYVRDLYAKSKIALKPGEGLTAALAEAEAVAKGFPAGDAGTEEDWVNSVNAYHAV